MPTCATHIRPLKLLGGGGVHFCICCICACTWVPHKVPMRMHARSFQGDMALEITVAPLNAWMHLTHFSRHVDECSEISQIHWDLQTPCERFPIDHGLNVLHKYMGLYSRYKIGHTFQPLKRWHFFGTCRQWVARLSFVFVTDNPHESTKVETRMVRACEGDPRMLNWRPDGGGGTLHGHSPFFVYVAFS